MQEAQNSDPVLLNNNTAKNGMTAENPLLSDDQMQGYASSGSENFDFDKSIRGADVASLQQVSFQVDSPNESLKGRRRGKLGIRTKPLTPTMIGSEVLDKINSHIEEMDVVDTR